MVVPEHESIDMQKMKIAGSLLKINLVTIHLFLLFFIADTLYMIKIEQENISVTTPYPAVTPQVLGVVEDESFPIRLKIPVINVDATIEYVGVTSDGEMAIPSNTINVGLFKLGPLPGKQGSAVISGHVNGTDGKDGVFFELKLLKQGDTLYVEELDGTITAFIVRETQVFDPGYAEDVFAMNVGAHLNLITCDGEWDETTQSYDKRLVVFTDRMN